MKYDIFNDMGNICCCRTNQKKKIVLLLLGLDNAGKTVAAKNLAGEVANEVIPTIGFSVVNLTHKNYKIKVFDLGGGPNIRGIWSRYFVDAHGIIFVVDSSDLSRITEVKEVLHNLLLHEKVSGKPLLLLANKQDYDNALDEIDLIETLQLEELVNAAQCPTLVESSSASDVTSKSKLDPGIKRGYNWIINYIIREYDCLNKRVERDVHEQEELEKKTRQEIIDRLKIMNEEERLKKRDDDIIELYSEYNEKMNGNAKIPIRDDNSMHSSDSLPHIYHGTVNDIQQERPKSATQLVKNQLELDKLQKKKSLKRNVNKTEPVNLYGIKMPLSAHEPRQSTLTDPRSLRSAGDSVFVVSDLQASVPYNVGDGDLHRQLFELNNFDVKNKLPPLKQNGVAEENSISIVDVD